MTDISLESYLIRDLSDYCNEISSIATEAVSSQNISPAGQSYISRIKKSAENLVRNKNSKEASKNDLNSMKITMNQLKDDISKKKFAPTEMKAIAIAILGIAATLLVSLGAVKIASKIKNAINKDDPSELEEEVRSNLEENGVATEGINLPIHPFDAIDWAYDHPNSYVIICILTLVVLPAVLIWKFYINPAIGALKAFFGVL